MGESREIQQLLSIIDQAYDHRSWHGTNLRGSIRGLSAERAARRPLPERHNIWELVVHTAYWKYAVTRRLTGQKRGAFPLKGSNFFPRGQSVNEAQWREDVLLLEKMHRALREASRSCQRVICRELRKAGAPATPSLLRVLRRTISTMPDKYNF